MSTQRKIFFILLVSFISESCEKTMLPSPENIQTNGRSASSPDTSNSMVDERREGIGMPDESKKLAEMWDNLVNSESCIPGNWMESEQVSIYIEFRGMNRRLTVPFLVEKLPSTSATSVHICPMENALEGELALYVLEIVFSSEWHEYRGPNEFLMDKVREYEKAMSDEDDFPLNWSQLSAREIAKNESATGDLIAFWEGRAGRKE